MSRRDNAKNHPCKWWQLCGNQATHYRRAVAIGDVPMCDHCGAFYTRASQLDVTRPVEPHEQQDRAA